MIVRRQGGLTEFIPSPQEKRDGVLRDHSLELLANLDARMRRIEERHGISPDAAEAFAELMPAGAPTRPRFSCATRRSGRRGRGRAVRR